MTKKQTAKNIKKPSKSTSDMGELEKLYEQYLIPMSTEQWNAVRNLSQPSILRQLPSRTTHSSAE